MNRLVVAIRESFRAGFILLFFLSWTACTKEDQEIISGNTAPPDKTLPASVRINFINKLYIGVLGREPDNAESTAALQHLGQQGFKVESRRQLVETVLADPAFFDREFELWRADLLNNTDTLQINQTIGALQLLIDNPANAYMRDRLLIELNRLNKLTACPAQLKSGAIGIREMQRRCIDNLFYDQINMGSLNFVISSIQHFFQRSPTAYEQQEGVKMVDGFSGVMLLQVGASKDDYMNILFGSTDYAEGQVKILFNRFLLRSPGTEELVYFTNRFKKSGDYKSLIQDLLETDEYAGIKP